MEMLLLLPGKVNL